MQREKIRNLGIASIKSEKIIVSLYIIILICGVLMYSMVPLKPVIRYVWRFGTIVLFGYSAISQKYSYRQWGMFLLLSHA